MNNDPQEDHDVKVRELDWFQFSNTTMTSKWQSQVHLARHQSNGIKILWTPFQHKHPNLISYPYEVFLLLVFFIPFSVEIICELPLEELQTF